MKIRNSLFLLSLLTATSFVAAGVIGITQIDSKTQEIFAAEPNLRISNNQEFADFISNVSNGTTYENQTVSLDADVSITLASKPNNGFSGTFEGNNHKITITIDTTKTAVSLFRNINSAGIVRNFNIVGTIENSGTYASPLAVYNNGTVRNVTSSIEANLPNVDYVSGILFRNNSSGKMYNCSFDGEITGKNYVGGIVSDNMRYMTGCVNSGTVRGTNYVGGIAATTDKDNSLKDTTYLRVINCSNNGNVIGKTGGGIIGTTSRGLINKCVNNSSVSGDGYIGGISGTYLGGTISECVNRGSVTSTTRYVGGITSVIGSSGFDEVILTLCENEGSINGTTDVGGIAGFLYPNSKIKYCSNYGDVSSEDTSFTTDAGIGGIVGRINGECTIEGSSTKIEYCYNGGTIKANRLLGGLIGLISSKTNPAVQVNGCFVTGLTKATTSSGNANCGTLVGFVKNGFISVDSQTKSAAAYQVESGVTAATYGYGIGAGSARSDTSKIAESSSESLRSVVKFIREYTCSEDTSTFKTTYDGLDSSENNVLDSVYYFDEHAEFVQRTYKGAAEYIIGYSYYNTNALSSFYRVLGENSNDIIIVVIVGSLLFASTLLILFKYKKRKLTK